MPGPVSNSCCERPPVRDHTAACPDSREPGLAVGICTVHALSHLPVRPGPGEGEWWLCETPDCPVVYFDSSSGRTLLTSHVRCRVATKVADGPKPVCYCFSFTDADVVTDLQKHGRSRVKEYIRERVRDRSCECEIRNPSGRCCLPSLQRVIKHAAAAPPADRPST